MLCARIVPVLCKKLAILDPFSSILQRFLNHCCCLAKYGDAFSQCLLQCRTSYFPPHLLAHTFSFSMDLSIGDRMFYTRSNSVRVSATDCTETAREGFVYLEYY
uniref:Uncharacterized protein n=1 Tax=Eutreptiella gymnastica TaxID=73025 RepID=A0A7S4FP64_9EUGL|mmetsp:Transcript_37884/g.61703  ORF Transcript_37884/g.61703 Transcript_37884/m.61703 type:complete len:104 (+) Transcript_37884:444-755(+)